MSDFKIVKLLDPITINLNGPSFTGEYDNALTYSIGESVSYLGSSYVAIAVTTGNLPTDTAFWQLLAEKGDPGVATVATPVRNQTGTAIPKMSAVYLSGTTGLRPLIVLAQANSEAASSKTFGLTKTIINNNADGDVTHEGVLENLDTTAFAAGDLLWLSPTVAGGLTTTRPIQPFHAVFIGYVTRSHPTLGSIIISISNGQEIDELHDVLITSPVNGDVVQYDSSTLLWKNKKISYTHTQGSASATWTINHNLGFTPNVAVFSSGGVIVDAEIHSTSINQTIIYFNSPFAGTARLN